MSGIEPVALEVPLTLLAVAKTYLDTLVWLQLYSPPGAALFFFVRSPPRVRPFASVPVYDMSLTHVERLRAVGNGFTGKLVWLLSMGVGRRFEPAKHWGTCCKMMQCNLRHVAAGLAAAVLDGVVKEAEELCTSGQCAAALVPLQRAIDLGHLPSRALKAWLLVRGRAGVAEDRKAAAALANEGLGLGCHHCQGVMAYCHFVGFGGYTTLDPYVFDEDRALELARESSEKGSRYGQHALGELLHDQFGSAVQRDDSQAVVFYRAAAAQGLDAAQCSLGKMYQCGYGVAQDNAEALRLYQLAAAQGLSEALFSVGLCHELGYSVPVDVEVARSWFRRAQAAGHHLAANRLFDEQLGSVNPSEVEDAVDAGSP
jgi:TPR repeat protein